jgi:tRNA G10  N-methylase Trm11
MDFPALIDLPFIRENSVSPQDSADDQYPESLPRYFVEHFTKKGDRVFDPFMGHGTTAFVAEELGRIPYGIEADMQRYEWAAGQLEHWNNMRCADAVNSADQGFPKMDFCITSPPFMMKNHRWNPLYAGQKAYNGYSCYIERLNEIFAAIKMVMKKNALMVVHVDNLQGAVYTPLVRDFSITIGEHFNPVGETIIRWSEGSPERLNISHALIFKTI